MANEVELNASLTYADSEFADEVLQVLEAKASVSTKKYVKAKVSVGTSEEAIDLGEVTSLGWSMFINRDATNYLELRSGTGASNDIIKIPAGMFALFHWGSDVTAPYAIAPTAACQMEYFIAST